MVDDDVRWAVDRSIGDVLVTIGGAPSLHIYMYMVMFMSVPCVDRQSHLGP